MGMYTEVFFRAVLSKDVPPEIIALISKWVEGEPPETNLPDHPLFSCSRWQVLPTMQSDYHPSGGPILARADWGSTNLIFAFHSSLKNYSGEAEKFFDWISPYTKGFGGEFLGYTLHEESTTPTLFFRTETPGGFL